MVFLSIWETSWYTRSPHHQKLSLHIVVEELRCPSVYCCGVHSCGNEPLRCPMDQILRGTIPKALVTPPATGPDEMERTIGAFHDRRVAHHLLQPYFRTQENTLDGVPSDAIITIDKPQTLGSGFVEGCRHINVLRL